MKKDKLVAPVLLVLSILGSIFFESKKEVELLSPYISSNFQVQASEVISAEAGQDNISEPVSEKEKIVLYIREVFGEHADDAIRIVGECENKSWNTKATNYNKNGTIDRGIFQLNSAYWGGEENFDWKTNIDKAYVVFTRSGKTFKPWTCATILEK